MKNPIIGELKVSDILEEIKSVGNIASSYREGHDLMIARIEHYLALLK